MNPVMKLKASNAIRLVVVANPIVKMAPIKHNSNTRGRRFTISPKGVMSSKPVAYPLELKTGHSRFCHKSLRTSPKDELK